MVTGLMSIVLSTEGGMPVVYDGCICFLIHSFAIGGIKIQVFTGLRRMGCVQALVGLF